MTDKIEKKESSEPTTKSNHLVGVDNIEPLIKIIRGQQVMLDRVLALAVAFYKIPYPISIEANGEVVNHRTVQVFVPYKYLYLFNEPRTAHISFEGYDNISYQFDVTSHDTKLVHKEDGNYFIAAGIRIILSEYLIPISTMAHLANV